MKQLFIKKYIFIIAFCFSGFVSYSQPKGKLFIIGGGDRSPGLMKELVKTADLKPNDYTVILPMATSIPEESIAFFSEQLSAVNKNHIASFNFTKEQAGTQQAWIDSVQNAGLIYITGGDQNKFMNVVAGTKLYAALHKAYQNGATISGTSAGAAIMSEIMITGEERDKSDKGGFKEIKKNNALTATGMGFVTKAIIDQHFIIRSRYNRLLSVLSDHPDKIVIGIDESTAIIISGKKVRVTGESQVLAISHPQKLKLSQKEKPGFKNAVLSLYVAGDEFELK